VSYSSKESESCQQKKRGGRKKTVFPVTGTDGTSLRQGFFLREYASEDESAGRRKNTEWESRTCRIL